MPHRVRILAVLAPLAVLASGCASSPKPAQQPPGPPPAEAEPARQPTSWSGDPGAPTPQEMQEVMAQIREVGQLDPDAQDRLLENLRQTSPDLWPLVARQFQAALAYRRQAEERARAERNAAEQQPAEQVAVARREQPPANAEPQKAGPESAAACHWPDAVPPGGTAEGGTGPQTPSRPAAPAVRAADQSPPPLPASPPNQGRGSAGQPAAGAQTNLPRAVVPAGYDAAAAVPRAVGDWRAALEQAIGTLSSQLDRTPQTDRELAHYARLRLLQLAAGRRQEALAPVPAGDPSLQEFWSRELFGLGVLLETDAIADPAVRVAEAQRHLSDALACLSETAPLVVRNLAFVTRVDNYGTFTPFEKYEFRPNQRVILYAEIENFKSQQTPQGFHTALKSSYQIFDSRGQRVADQEFAPNEEYCRNRRRDYFIGYEFSMPARIYPGRYVLQLTVADLNSQKIGQSSIEFTIADLDE